jgi:hypothetical protein
MASFIVMGVFAVFGLVGAFFLLRALLRLGPQGGDALSAFAASRGWQFTPLGPTHPWRLEGMYRGVPIVVTALLRRRRATINLALGRAPLPIRSTIIVRFADGRPPQPPGTPRGLVVSPTDDRLFDGVYVVETDDAAAARRLLDPPLRSLVAAQVRRGFTLVIKGGIPTVYWFPAGLDVAEPALDVVAAVYARFAGSQLDVARPARQIGPAT